MNLTSISTADLKKELESRGFQVKNSNDKEKIFLHLQGILRNGGTRLFKDKKGNNFFLDGKIGSPTCGQLFKGSGYSRTGTWVDKNDYVLMERN